MVGCSLNVRNECMSDTNTSAVINRHMARLLSQLEDAGCPILFREAVKGAFVWLRDDLTKDTEENDHKWNR